MAQDVYSRSGSPGAPMPHSTAYWRDYLELCKPNVVALMIFTAVVGMLLATPGDIPWWALTVGNLGIALSAGSAAAINHLVDQHIDAQMARTRARPLPTGHLRTSQAVTFAAVLGGLGMAVLYFFVNPLTAWLTFLSLIGYAFVYTMYLKRATPQNIVIGGAAGAFPPMIGEAAVTGHVSLDGLALFAIIFLWTPPHFWALALVKAGDYARAGVPMMPNVAGADATRRQIMLYTLLLAPVGLAPVALGFGGAVYATVAGITGLGMVALAWRVLRCREGEAAVKAAQQLFAFSVLYLFLLFATLLAEQSLGFGSLFTGWGR